MKNGLEKARSLLNELFISIDIDGLKREIEGLTVQTMDENFWNDQDHARKIYDQLNEMKKKADTYDHLITALNELEETYQYVKESDDEDFKAVLDEDYLTYFQVNMITIMRYWKFIQVLEERNHRIGHPC